MKEHPKYQGMSDEALVAKFKNDADQGAFGALYARYAYLVFGVCLKYLKNKAISQDSTAQIFEKLLTDLHKHNIEYFRGWLHTTARNHCLMYLRNNHKLQFVDTNNICLESTDDISDAVLKEADLNALEQAMETLNHDQRTCIHLFYYKSLSYEAIVLQGIYTLNQVKSHIQNGKRNLKIYLTRKKGAEQIIKP
jgi:RNA polymerase sigma-70 factor (ECF subfamily)